MTWLLMMVGLWCEIAGLLILLIACNAEFDPLKTTRSSWVCLLPLWSYGAGCSFQRKVGLRWMEITTNVPCYYLDSLYGTWSPLRFSILILQVNILLFVSNIFVSYRFRLYFAYCVRWFVYISYRKFPFAVISCRFRIIITRFIFFFRWNGLTLRLIMPHVILHSIGYLQ